MKKILFAGLLSGLFAFVLQAQNNNGIEFFHGTWPEAMQKAQAENKLIFVDAYAEWCGPCKKMAKTVFTDPEVGAFFNANFLCLKIDMEKEENVEFATKYPVSAFPTLMMLEPSGKVVQKQVGAMAAEGLIQFGQKAMNGQDKSAEYAKQYEEGSRDPQLVFDYVRALNRAGKPSLKITNEYLLTQKDLTTPFNLKFILEGAVEADSRVFSLLEKYRPQIVALEGEANVNRRIAGACKNTARKALEFRNEELLAEAKEKMKRLLPAESAAFEYESDSKYYIATKNVEKYLKTTANYREDVVKNNSAKLHDLVVNIVRAFPDDPKALKQAEKWAKTAAENGGLPEYYMTLAGVYKRQGNKEKARETAKKAREMAKDNENGLAPKIDYFIDSLN